VDLALSLDGVELKARLDRATLAHVSAALTAKTLAAVRRVLRDDGTLWLNLGDSYVGATSQHKDGGSQGHNSVIAKKTMGGIPSQGRGDRNRKLYESGLAMKQLIGIPWRVAFALQADGWYLRQDIIWHKPNPMPESVTDRCTKAHEYLFLLSKSPRYYFDADAIKEGAVNTKMPGRKIKQTTHYGEMNGGNAGLTSFIGKYHEEGLPKHRNRRSVWTVTTKPFKGAHFATFPPDLIEPCILAGCPVGGVVLDPFGGSGTTAGVALKNGRKAVLCELNPEYAAMMPARIAAIAGDTPDMFLEILA
jgi:site-specific DNA-methyltransferase (adenine-specific)